MKNVDVISFFSTRFMIPQFSSPTMLKSPLNWVSSSAFYSWTYYEPPQVGRSLEIICFSPMKKTKKPWRGYTARPSSHSKAAITVVSMKTSYRFFSQMSFILPFIYFPLGCYHTRPHLDWPSLLLRITSDLSYWKKVKFHYDISST